MPSVRRATRHRPGCAGTFQWLARQPQSTHGTSNGDRVPSTAIVLNCKRSASPRPDVRNPIPLLGAALIGVAFAAPVRAESLRCSGGSSEVGDSRLSVLFKCGEPLLRDAYCAPVFYQGSLNPVPEPFASLAVRCLPIDEWIYDRGPGNLMATVRFRGGQVLSIRYSRSPQ